jgi:regulator of protease activity HflC (stomatin/prohibitin superfamily)
MSALSWISEIINWFGRFIPRLVIVRSTHAGVRFRHGYDPIAIEPGIRCYWPLVTEVEIVPVARQTHNLPTQALLTSDKKRVVVSGVVVYKVRDIVACVARNWDIADTINDITLVAVTKIVTTHTLDYLLEHLTDEVQDKLSAETKKKLRVYGIGVYWTALTDFAECMIIKNISSDGRAGTVIAGE